MSTTREPPSTRSGPPQRTPRSARWSAPDLALVACTLLVVLASWWSKRRCLGPGGWDGGRQFTERCYTDLAPLWFGRGLADGTGPWGADPLEYPVLLSVQAWLTAEVTHLLPGDAGVQVFLDVNAVLAGVQAVAVLVLLRRAGVDRRRLLWWAAAPALAFYALYNWDLLPVLLLVAAVVAHREGRHGASGALAGLGAATKLFPAVLVPLVVLELLREGHRRSAARHAVAAGAAWAAVNLPAYLAAPDAWTRFYALNSSRGGHVDSLWHLAQRLTGWTLAQDQLNLLGPLLLVVGATAVVAVGVRRLPPEQTWRLVLPVLVVFLLTNKVFSPQYFLWLVPLMLLCGTRTRVMTASVLADVLVFAVELPVLGGRAGVEPSLPYAALGLAVALRAAALLWVAADVLRAQPQASSQYRRSAAASVSGTPTSTGHR